MSNQNLAHALKLKYGLAPHEPSAFQLQGILSDFSLLVKRGGIVAEEDVLHIVRRHCPTAGHYMYKGLDNSDILALLKLATKGSP